ncbi:Methyltransferase domain-containing protein [Formosa sp. Hel1_31_208]|uniref:O-methyltransferase n=1 Tax=Formosa sp. Hel1_31_208 TaxID=1798225 RepID=UPI00087B710C|nr:class I SAM-dependent methyltransferase [Formosa sp. Hel1_31_208]SDS69828.1 Methyltransferase domain-containing protein [Formosa sp. Hel1_31_208]
MFQILEYIKFLFKSTNQHGVHSPFVYDLVTKCFYDTSSHEAYSQLLDYRTALLQHTGRIEITDFGSGSRVFNSNSRRISALAKTSGSSLKRAQLLYRIVRYFKPKHSLELGTSLGIATHAMALGHHENSITTIEGCPKVSAFTAQQLRNYHIHNVTLENGEFGSLLPTLNHHSYDLVFFDGNHHKTATLDYFHSLLESAHNDSIFIFDDIYWSKSMMEAWEIIKTHPKVSVTIDTFYWGFVFFRKEQAKENFIIRV